jgi:ribonuclease-3
VLRPSVSLVTNPQAEDRLLRAEVRAEDERLRRAQHAIGHTFRDPSWLLRALTHRSYLNENRCHVGHNEVLEWVGDAVLSLVTVEILLAQTPDAQEGELTARRARHVSEEALAAACTRIGAHELLRVGKGIGGAVPTSTRADLIEALIGAVYRDGGLDPARTTTVTLLGQPPHAPEPRADSAKTRLQERLQGLFGATPVYAVARSEGPAHAPVYVATVTFQGEALGRGEGANKRIATEAAAAAACEGLPSDEALRARFGKDTR